MRDVVRCDLLPTAEMVISLSKEFGIPLNDDELKELKSIITPEEIAKMCKNLGKDSDDNEQEAGSGGELKTERGYEWISNGIQAEAPHTSRIWTPIDNFNDKYLLKRKERSNQFKNHVIENIDAVQEISEMNK